MKKVYLLQIALCAMALAGCASKGFNRGELKEQIGATSHSYDDKTIKQAFSKKPNLPKPFKLGIFFKSPNEVKHVKSDWRWTEEDRSRFLLIASELKSQGLISDAFPILNSLVEKDDLRSLRMAAARHQADALLVVGGAGSIERSMNALGWTYLLILPTLFVKGSETETLFITQGSLWDVKNGYLYLTAEAESDDKKTYAALTGDSDRELLKKAKESSLEKLKSELQNMIKGAKL